MNSCPDFGPASLGTRVPMRAMASWLRRLVLVSCIGALAACATTPSPSAAPSVPAPAVVSMDEWMNRGDAAVKEGDHTRARDAWRSAARDYPTAKEPWLKLSEDYFNAEDYGNAVLAVSGLRLTAGSLQALRDDGGYAVGSRDEAVAVTHALREALGEPVLVPPADSATPARKHVARAPHPAARASAAAGDATAVANAAPAPAPAPVPQAAPAVARTPRAASTPPAGNPLDKLK